MKVPPEFTKWWEEHGRFVRAGGGQYEISFAFAAWNASREAALEEAANVCDEKQDWYEKDRCMGQATAVGACAEEIRAIAASDSDGGA
jgi:hypothetical protein